MDGKAATVDRWGRRLADAEPWRTAATLDEIGELTARWLEGRLLYQPAYLAPGPAPETARLVPVLARVNRRGLVTRCSQPGMPRVEGWTQRAWVTGFAGPEAVLQLEDVVRDSEVVLLATPPCAEWNLDVPVTLNGDRANTHGGRRLDRAGIAFHYEADAPAAVTTLSLAWQVDLFDPCWGRNKLLWELLDRWCDRP